MSPEAERDDLVRIVAAGDDRYFPGLAVAIASALRRLKGVATVVILDAGLSPESRERLLRLAAPPHEVSIRPLDVAALGPLPMPDRFTAAAYARVMAPAVLPVTTNTIIYLDADTLTTTDIAGIWRGVPAAAPGAAAVDDGFPTVASGFHETPDRRNPGDDYFNSGVMAINLGAWRREHVAERILLYSRTNAKHVRFAEQDGINAVLGDRLHVLEGRWNFQLRNKPPLLPVFGGGGGRVLHYVARKPWLPGALSVRYLPWVLRWLWEFHRSGVLDADEELRWLHSWWSDQRRHVRHALGRRAAFCKDVLIRPDHASKRVI